MIQDRLQIVCATDNNYVPYCGIMLTSVLENNHGVDVYIIVDESFADASRSGLQRLEQKYSDCSVHFVAVDKSCLNGCRTDCNEYISIATYYRLFVTELLPRGVQKVLYLDCDIVVNGSLDEFWHLNMSDSAIAGVPDIYSQNIETYERMQYPMEKIYVNAGVLLMNLDYWRSHRVYERCMEYIANNQERLLWCDQDVLNAVLYDEKVVLPLRWNYQIPMLLKFHFDTFDKPMQQLILAERNPVIIHYVSRTKPWNIAYYDLPYDRLWRSYKRKSLWRYIYPQMPKEDGLKTLVKRYILWPLGRKRNVLTQYVENGR